MKVLQRNVAIRSALAMLAVSGVIGLPHSAFAATYFVSSGGADTAAGTAAAPWKTLQKAADTVVAGDTVVVRAGRYTTGMNIYGRPGGTAAHPITFSAEPGATITHCASKGPNASAAAINIEQSGNYWIIENFTVVGDGSMQKAGIRVTGSNFSQINNNTVSETFTGIFVSNSDSVIVQGNTCHDSTDQHGIYMSGDSNYIVRGNTLYNSNWDGLHLNIIDGTAVPNLNGLVEGNFIFGCNLSGVDMEGVQNTRFVNNLIVNNAKHGFTLHNLDQPGTSACTGNVFVNNTIVDNGMFGIQMAAGGNSANTLLNNIFVNGSNNYGAIGVSGAPSGLMSDYNIVTNRFSTNLGSTEMTLTAWQSATGLDSHSSVHTSSELFINAANGDFHLKFGSAAIDTATSTQAPSNDFDESPRPSGSGFDIGAFELQQGGGPTPTPTATPTPTSTPTPTPGASPSATATPTATPTPPPTSIPAPHASHGKPRKYVKLSWSNSALRHKAHRAQIRYMIYRSETLGGKPTILGATSKTHWHDDTGLPAKHYFYSVSVIVSGVEGARSSESEGWR